MPYSNQVSPSQTLISVFVGQIGGVAAHVCDARELHAYLKNGDKFADWIKARIEQGGFTENQDFACLSVNTETQRKDGQKGVSKRTDYHLTLNTGKHLGMMERNDQGKSIRDYFIAAEAEALAAAGQALKPPVPSFEFSKDRMDAAAAFIRNAAMDLNLAQSSVLGMYQKLEIKAGLTGLLIGYAVDAPMGSAAGSSELTKSLSELLEQFKVGISTVSMNRLLIKNGMLEENERPSTTKGVKKFKTVIDLHFGKNLTNPNNPRETQPHWFVSKFEELLRRVMPLTVPPLPSMSCTLN